MNQNIFLDTSDQDFERLTSIKLTKLTPVYFKIIQSNFNLPKTHNYYDLIKEIDLFNKEKQDNVNFMGRG